MRTMSDIASSLAVVLASALCSAQTLPLQERCDPGGAGPAFETAIAIDPNDTTRALAVWMDYRNGERDLGIGARKLVSGLPNWSSPVLPIGPGSAEYGDSTSFPVDPTVVFHPAVTGFPDGVFLVGGFYPTTAYGANPFVMRILPGDTAIIDNRQIGIGTAYQGAADKTVLAVGPRHGASGTNAYMAWNRSTPHNLLVAKSETAGDTWPTIVDTGLTGFTCAVAVLSNGRVVMLYLSPDESNIRVTWSDDNGSSWQSPFTFPASEFSAAPGSALPGDFRTGPGFGMGVHPLNDDVYVTYYGMKKLGGGTFSTSDVDVFIAKSDDDTGTMTFDTWKVLGGASGTDQFITSVAVDGCGGVNVMYYETSDADTVFNTSITGKWVRITDPSSDPTPANLTHPSFPSEQDTGFDAGWPPGSQFVGDYNQIVAVGNIVYAAYMAVRKAAPSTDLFLGHIYARRIRILSCELDGNGVVGMGDITAFSDAYEKGAVDADMDGDADVDVGDYVAFMKAYSEETGKSCH